MEKVVDYFSRFIEVSKLSSTSSEAVIEHLKSIFSRHGIPETVISDNGPQYSAAIFGAFAIQYGFTHTTSSPRYPQANGAAERAVRTVKELLVKNKDPYLAMLAYRSTPLENGYSPAELLMGRQIRTTIPVITKPLIPKLPKKSLLQQKEENMRQQNFDYRHGETVLKPFKQGESVWILDCNTRGTVMKQNKTQSYVVQVPEGGTYQRNRRHLLPMPDESMDKRDGDDTQSLLLKQSKMRPLLQTLKVTLQETSH